MSIMKFKKLLSIVISICFLFKAFGEEMPEVIENEKGEPIGIILHLPQDLIDACKCSFWKLKDDELKKHVENCMKNQQGFFKWCEENSCGTTYLHSKRCEIAC